MGHFRARARGFSVSDWKYYGGTHVVQNWNELSCVGGGQAECVHEKVSAATDDVTESGGVMSIHCVEASPFIARSFGIRERSRPMRSTVQTGLEGLASSGSS